MKALSLQNTQLVSGGSYSESTSINVSLQLPLSTLQSLSSIEGSEVDSSEINNLLTLLTNAGVDLNATTYTVDINYYSSNYSYT